MADKTKKSFVGTVLSWIFGILFLFLSLVIIEGSIFLGILAILFSLLVIPYFRNIISKKLNINFTIFVNVVIYLILISLIAFGMESLPDYDGVNQNDTPSSIDQDGTLDSNSNTEDNQIQVNELKDNPELVDYESPVYNFEKFTDILFLKCSDVCEESGYRAYATSKPEVALNTLTGRKNYLVSCLCGNLR